MVEGAQTFVEQTGPIQAAKVPSPAYLTMTAKEAAGRPGTTGLTRRPDRAVFIGCNGMQRRARPGGL
jgi:hypothetical protein